jgi:hypothetical protein
MGARFSASAEAVSGVRPTPYTRSTGSLSRGGGKVAGAWRQPQPPPSAEVKERVELYLYSHSGPSWPVLGRTLSFSFTLKLSSSFE